MICDSTCHFANKLSQAYENMNKVNEVQTEDVLKINIRQNTFDMWSQEHSYTW